jgi:hypothetical protein
MVSIRKCASAALLAAPLLLPATARAGLDSFFLDLVDVQQDNVLFQANVEADLDTGTPPAPDDPTNTAVFFGDVAFDPNDAVGNLSSALFGQLQQFPVGSTVAGFTYEFDPNLAIFVRSTQGMGPVLAERAQTNGKGKLNVSMAYSRMSFDVFEGHELDSLRVSLDGSRPALINAGAELTVYPDLDTGSSSDTIRLVVGPDPVGLGPGDSLTFRIDGSTGTGTPVGDDLIFVISDGFDGSPPSDSFGDYTVTPEFPVVTLDGEIDVDLLALFMTYGITDWLDAGIVVPLMRIELTGQAVTTGIIDEQSFTDDMMLVEQAPTFSEHDNEEKYGIGDVVLRAKARVFETEYADLAGRFDVSLPTGDEDDLFGRGHSTVFGQAIVSEQFGRFSPHVNLGLFIDTEDNDQSQIRYAAGVDVRVHERVTIAGDFIGSRDLDSDGVGDTQIAASGGLKVNVWRRLILSGNALVRLNAEGLRSDVIPSGAIEYTFF